MPNIKIGLEKFLEAPPKWAFSRRLGLLCNPASVDSQLRHSIDLIRQRFPGSLRALFSPQHGLFAEKQANMVESADTTYRAAALPVYSLYGKILIPTEPMLADIDVLLVDLQDVGTRVYTFISTLSYCLEAAAQYGKRVVILDRPNPLGGAQVEGNCVADEYRSFVGRYPIPMRHGLTLGEFGWLINHRFDINCRLEVVPMEGWRRDMYFDQTGLTWIAPSPNMPTPATAWVYPGQVIWEGTNVSEGRGTTQPFELFGAPYIDPKSIQAALAPRPLAGLHLRQAGFEPLADKWQGRLCQGFQLHPYQSQDYQPFRTSLSLLQMILKHFPKQFHWTPPPYEYDYVNLPIDLILGSAEIRRGIEQQVSIDDLEAGWRPGIRDYLAWREPYLLYA